MILQTIGWLGSILFALCAVPQAWKSFKEKSAEGLSWTFLLMWLFGEVLCLTYAVGNRLWPLVFNYVFNLMALIVILRYKLK